MKTITRGVVAGLFLVCGAVMQSTYADSAKSAREVEADIKAAFAELSPSDRAAAEMQRWCPNMPDDRLGSMGTPVRILIEGKPVFLCCADCEAGARANPKATLAKAEKLTKVNAAFAKLTPIDRHLAESQRYCAVQTKSELGSMGTPVKVALNGQPAFLCCGSCKKAALADPKATLEKVKKLTAAHSQGHGHEHGNHK